MRSPSHLRLVAVAMWSVFALFGPTESPALTLVEPGYSEGTILTMSAAATGIRLGPDGVLYLFHTFNTNGIRKVSALGVESPWSAVQVRDLAVSASGGGIGAGAWPCNCLVRIEPNGSFSTFAQDSLDWYAVDVAPDGTIFAAGTLNGNRVYRIDPLTEERTLIADASVGYESLQFGHDGSLYAITYGIYPEKILARFDGSQFVQVGVLPHGGWDLSRGADGNFWLRTTHDYGSGRPIGEIWAIHSTTGNSTMLAQTEWVDAQFWGVQYDPGTRRLYVGDPSHHLLQPLPVLRAVTGGLLPTRSATWGAIKARYRGASESGSSTPE